MRKIIITGTPPQDWIDKSDTITKQLKKASSAAARKKILKKKKAFGVMIGYVTGY